MRILVADDHKLVRDGLRPFLRELDSEAEIIDAASLEEAVAAIEGAPRPDLVLLDLMMPGMTGLDGLTRIKTLAPGIPVVIVSGYSSRDHVQAAVQAGAAGFIPKTVGGNAMVNALRLVLSGETYLPSSSFFETTGSAPAAVRQTGAPPPFDRLSRREGEILAQLIEGRTNKEIAQALNLQEITIKVHLRNVYRKIGAANRAQAVRIALQSGWDIPPIAPSLPRPVG
ncbi:response regulator transcription factor [Magnetospirillum molischianum]|uniref:Putative two-component DNA-binding response regulator (LuxR family) n=1 Tax=Magnetospirillum molischianum DSM 120 TaxID=1150626 RepID=H8FV67_MAGML|nr:response regulator transcription factor [Magnetospirillum molischianum]CCG42255.1 Putative two-component DNA-binding response regulator (LuxR family) [Magnetospirillum molischianum DSM 120]